MPFSFPASPSVGATSVQNGRQYIWSGYAWELVSASSGLSWSSVPASATATGTAGQIAWDATYFYYATATNTWLRLAGSTWYPGKSPDQITGLVGWWDFSDTATLYNATSGGSVVTSDAVSVYRVEDKSGNGKHLITGNAPTYKQAIANGRGIVRFNGTSNYITNNSFPYADSNMSAFVVCKTASIGSTWQTPVTVFPATNATAPNDDYVFFSLQDNGSSPARNRFQYGGANTSCDAVGVQSGFTVYGISASSGVSALTVNGTSVATGTATDAGKSSSGTVSDIPARSVLNVGAFVRPANTSGLFFWPGDMCEIAWYASDISSSDKTALVQWLKSKWGIA